MRRAIIVGLMVLTLLVVGAAVVLPKTPWWHKNDANTQSVVAGSQRVQPELRIAIASRESLVALVNETKEIAWKQLDCVSGTAKANAAQNTSNGQSGMHGANRPAVNYDGANESGGGGSDPDADDSGVDAAFLTCQLGNPGIQQALIDAMSNQLESQLSGDIAKSGRLDVVEPSTVLAAFQKFSSQDTDRDEKIKALVEEVQDSQAKKSLLGRTREDLAGELSALLDQSGPGRSANIALATDFSKIAKELDVGYFLFVDLYEPGAIYDVAGGAYDAKKRVLLRANPLFVYRLYDVTNQRVLLSSQERLANGFAIDIGKSVIGRLRDAGYGGDLDAMTRAWQSVFSESGFERMNSVSAMIARSVLDEIAPAQIASDNQVSPSDPVVVTRGANDGVVVGDTFEVRQFVDGPDGKPIEIRDPGTGVVIERPTKVVGKVTVTEVLAGSNSASAVRVGDGGSLFRRGDLLVPLSGALAEAAQAASATSRVRPSGVPAGSGPLGTVGRNDQAARIAVTDFEITGISDYYERSELRKDITLALMRRLSTDKRYQVVDRQDLNKIQEEYDLSLEVAGQAPTGDRAPVQIAGYIVTGVLDVGEEETRRSISLRGETRSLPSTFQMRVSGEVRILDSASAVVVAKRIDVRENFSRAGLGDAGAIGALADVFAFEAAKVLRTELYPLKIAHVSADGKSFIVNGGEDVGLKKNAILNVYSTGEAIIDPDTQTVLSKGARTLLGTILVTDVNGAVSTAIAKSLNGAALQVGYVVELTDRVDASASGATAKSAAPAARETTEPDVPF